MNIQKMKISDLNPAKYNPRKKLKPGDTEFEKLKRSIENFGMVEPPIFNTRTGTLVGGHQRVSVMKHLGYTETEVVIIDISLDEEKALNVALNKIEGEWDAPLLTILLEEIGNSSVGIEVTGFDPKEIEKLFAENDKKEISDDNFNIEKAVSEPSFVLSGDLWHLKNHRLLIGDSTKIEDITRLMNGKKANLLLTDFPYNVNYEGKAGKIQNDNMSPEKFFDFLLTVFKNIETALDDEASAYVFHSDTNGEYFRRAFREAGFKLSGVCQWVKPSLVLGRSPYQWQNEPCLFGWKIKGKHKWFAGRSETTIWQFDKPTKNKLHPNCKPLELLALPIKNSSQANGIVLDLFGGSGSTMISCQMSDRICYMSELDPKYASVILRRYAENFGGENIVCERNGEILKYSDLVKAVEMK